MTDLRKIDALIAEHVVHLRVSRYRDDYIHHIREVSSGNGGTTWTTYRSESIPFYSTNIAAAWEAVEKMGHVALMWESESNDTRWECVLDRKSSYADTAPLAICLAALRARGIEVGDD